MEATEQKKSKEALQHLRENYKIKKLIIFLYFSVTSVARTQTRSQVESLGVTGGTATDSDSDFLVAGTQAESPGPGAGGRRPAGYIQAVTGTNSDSLVTVTD